MKCAVFLAVALCVSSSLGALESVPGVCGKGVSFSGSGDFLVFDDGGKFDRRGGMTVAFWVKADNWTHLGSMVCQGQGFAVKKRGKGNGGIYFSSTVGGRDNVDLVWAPEKFRIPTGKWAHLAVTYDPVKATGRAYLNGKFVAERNLAKDIPGLKSYQLGQTNNRLLLGDGEMPFEGTLDSVFIYKRALAEAEIKELMREKFSPDGLIAAYLMNDPQQPGFDSSPNKLHMRQTESFKNSVRKLGTSVVAPVLLNNSGLTVYRRQATDKVMQLDRVANAALSAESAAPAVCLAGNEYESFQLVVAPKKELRNVRLSFSAPELNGHKLALAAHEVAYVAIPQVSNTKLSKEALIFGEAGLAFDRNDAIPGMYPDKLIPIGALKSLAAGESRSFWITVKSSGTTPGGIYRGRMTIAADNMPETVVPFSVKVWNFSLPERISSNNSGVFDAGAAGKHAEDYYRFFAERHISMTPLFADVKVHFAADGAMSVDTAEFDRHARLAMDKYHANVLYFPGWSFYRMPKAVAALSDRWNNIPISLRRGELSPQFRREFARYLKWMAAHLKKNNWFSRTRITLVDEPQSADDYALCREMASLVRGAVPDLKIMVTKWPRRELIGSADIWCLGFFQPEAMLEAVKRGESLEWYPNWHVMIDRPLMDSRMIGFLMWKYRINGILFWKFNHGWGSRAALAAPRFVYPDGRVICGNGLLVYPTEDGRPLASIRLEMFRDAFEDLEYMRLLERLTGRNAEHKSSVAARRLLTECADAIVPAYYADNSAWPRWRKLQWESDGDKLQQRRVRIGDAIEKLLADFPQ